MYINNKNKVLLIYSSCCTILLTVDTSVTKLFCR